MRALCHVHTWCNHGRAGGQGDGDQIVEFVKGKNPDVLVAVQVVDAERNILDPAGKFQLDVSKGALASKVNGKRAVGVCGRAIGVNAVHVLRVARKFGGARAGGCQLRESHIDRAGVLNKPSDRITAFNRGGVVRIWRLIPLKAFTATGIGAGAVAKYDIIPCATVNDIIAGSGIDRVVAVFRQNRIVAAKAVDHVVIRAVRRIIVVDLIAFNIGSVTQINGVRGIVAFHFINRHVLLLMTRRHTGALVVYSNIPVPTMCWRTATCTTKYKREIAEDRQCRCRVSSHTTCVHALVSTTQRTHPLPHQMVR